MANLPQGARPLYRIMTEKSQLTFGRYNGLLVGDVLKIEPDYLGYAYYTFEMISFADNILDALKIERIPKPGKSEEVFNKWKHARHLEITEGMTEEEYMHYRVHNNRLAKGKAIRRKVFVENALHYSKRELQAINHGHKPLK